MTDQPFDPAASKTDQDKHEQTDTYDGQQGHGVQYEDGRYRGESADELAGEMRSGSFETNNIGDQTASQGYPQGGPEGGPSPTASPNPDETVVQPEPEREH